MTKSKNEDKEQKDTMVCTCCGNERKLDDYYSSQLFIHKHTGKMSICKDCIWGYVVTNDIDGYDYNRMIDLLQMIDKPYVHSLMEASIDETRKSGKNVFKIYMKNLGLRQNRHLRWSDSQFPSNNEVIYNSEDDSSVGIKINKEVMDYWGKGYTKTEYDFLENERFKLMTSFECPDYGMEMLMRDICFINLDIEKVRQERKDNNQKTLTNLIETRSKLMNDANMKPIQSTGAEANDQVTFGTLLKKWENERPVPKPLNDEMKEYIDTFMVGHLAKMEGLTNELTEKYDKVLSEYTINFNDINRDIDDFED